MVGVIKKTLSCREKQQQQNEQETIGYQDHNLYGSNYGRENLYSSAISKRISEVGTGFAAQW